MLRLGQPSVPSPTPKQLDAEHPRIRGGETWQRFKWFTAGIYWRNRGWGDSMDSCSQSQRGTHSLLPALLFQVDDQLHRWSITSDSSIIPPMNDRHYLIWRQNQIISVSAKTDFSDGGSVSTMSRKVLDESNTLIIHLLSCLGCFSDIEKQQKILCFWHFLQNILSSGGDQYRFHKLIN